MKERQQNVGTPTLCVTTHTRLKYLHLLNPLNHSELQRQTQAFLSGREEPQNSQMNACHARRTNNACLRVINLSVHSSPPPGGLAVYEAWSMEVMARRGPGWATECVYVGGLKVLPDFQ